MDCKEQEPFLLLEHQENGNSNSKEKSSSRRQILFNALFHTGLLFVYCIATYVITTKTCANDEQVFAGLAVNHKLQLYDKFNESPFAGPPSTKSDEAWHNLMLNMSVRVTKEELEKHGQTSVELPGGGYLAWLGVFHELHCVKILRQWIYKDNYYPNMTQQAQQHQEVHIDHCIDWLRNAAMCHADTSALAVFKWDKGEHPMLNTHRVVHKCVDWDTMMGSHKDRLVSHEEVARMRNPNLINSE